MKSASAKTVTICEKETEPDVLHTTSQCSCVQCDSYLCFALRNRTPCSCDKYPNLKDQFKDSKTSSKLLKVSFHNMDSFVNEFTYDNSNNNINTIHLSNSSCASSDTKGKIQKRSMGSTELSNTTTHYCKEIDYDSNTAKLSAQIMNLPYREFKESISQNKSDSTNSSKLPKIDIFRRIKDVYKACSCKVCECIVGKATNNDFYLDSIKKATKRDSRKQITNMKKMSQELEQSLRDANKKYAYVKCKNAETHYEITCDDFTAKDLSQKIFEQPVPKNIVENNDSISRNIIDFEKIKYNLQQAKAFSLELLSILRQYQNANNNFRKTFKFDCSKRLHSDVGIANCKENETHKTPVRVTTNEIQESRQLKSKLRSDVMKNENDKFIIGREPPVYNLRQETYERNLFQGDKHKEQDNFHSTSNNDYTVPTTSNNTELIDYLLNEYGKEPIYSMHNQSYVTNMENTKGHRLDVNDYTRGGNKINSKSYLNPTLKPVVNSIAYNNSISRFEHDAISEKLVPSKENDIKQSLVTPQTYSLQTRNFETINKISNPFVKNGLVKDKQCLSTSTSTITLDRSDNLLNELQEMCGATEVKHWSILNKNMNLYNSPFIKNKKGLCFIPTLTLEVKNVLRSISGQFNDHVNGETSTNVPVTPVTKVQGGSNTLSEMEFQIQNDFVAASSQTFQLAMIEEKGINCRNEESSGSRHTSKHAQNLKSTTSYHKKSLESSKSSCEAMKAKFLGLRRVSDHTVLVKWKVPKDITSVQGYELLVDGRAVQKILSPARCMAVVSCLPHLDQVLITIRTIVTPAAQQCKYLPTATVVYHPRIR